MSYLWKFEDYLPADRRNISDRLISVETGSIKLRSADTGCEGQNVTVRLVVTGEKIQAACDLVNERYGWRGYGANHRIVMDAHHITFTAEVDDAVVGTITLAIDSPHGLAADSAFGDAIDGFRARPGAKVCELTKFAFDPAVQSKALMATLFHIVFVYGRRTYACTDLFIEVNPRHVRFYETMLGFERVGSLRQNDSVAAPAQLMWLKVDAIREHINRAAAGTDGSRARSLYPLFFSPADENGIYQRLVDATARAQVTATRPSPRPVTEARYTIRNPARFRKARAHAAACFQ